MRYDAIYRMDEIKSLSFHIVLSFLSQNTLFTVITFHHLSDCDLYTPHTTGHEEETEAGGERPARHNEELVPKRGTTSVAWSHIFMRR